MSKKDNVSKTKSDSHKLVRNYSFGIRPMRSGSKMPPTKPIKPSPNANSNKK